MTKTPRIPLIALVLLIVVALAAPAGAATSAQSTRKQRDAARAKRAELARKLDALRASDAQLDAAVKVLTTQVNAQSAKAQAARQSVQAADATLRAAEGQLAATRTEIERLRQAVVERAVAAYIRPRQDSMASGNVADLAEASRRSALLDQVAKHDREVLDQLKAAQQDFELQQLAAQAARDVAARRRRVVEDRLRELRDAQSEKARLASALDVRIREYQAEVDALAGQEANLSRIIREGELRAGPIGGISSAGLIWPIRGRVTSEYGRRWGRMHAGIDIAAPTGTPIRAAKAGEVIYSGTMSGYGNVVIINHGGGFSTVYAHQSRRAAADGQQVDRGTVIGYVGSTGRSTGPHLHLETRVGGTAQNPRRYLP